jgi:geranylgeranyl reductase family protein
MPTDQYDIIVVGAGPAGSMAALHAAKSGAKTALLEGMRLPREKLCGGGVSAWVIKKLHIPSSIVDRTIDHAQVIAGTKMLPPVPWPENTAWRTVMRAKFDQYLASMAVKAGATLIQSTPVESVIFDRANNVCGVKTNTKRAIKSKVVIGCDGVSSTIARTSGFWRKWFSNDAGEWRKRCAYCTEAHFRLSDKEIDKRMGNTLYFFYERELLGYHWLFPKKGIITVGTGSATTSMTKKPLTYFNDFVRDNSIAANLLKGASMIGEVRGAYIPYSGALTPSYSDGVILAGDSAGMVGAVTGEGIYFAVRAGIAAGEVASEAAFSGDASAEKLSAYEKRWRMEIGKHLETQVQYLQQTRNPLKAMGLYTSYSVENQKELFPD